MKKDIYILAIESSCDETSASIIKNGCEDISTVINSQIDVHMKYGGVVPEVASRLHLENITMVINECMVSANMKFEDIDGNEVVLDTRQVEERNPEIFQNYSIDREMSADILDISR